MEGEALAIFKNKIKKIKIEIYEKAEFTFDKQHIVVNHTFLIMGLHS